MSLTTLSPAAENDLLEIWLYVAQDKVGAADRLIQRLRLKCDLLGQNPLAGRARSDLTLGLRSFSVDNYVVYYRVTRLGVEVARILSGYQDPTRIFED